MAEASSETIPCEKCNTQVTFDDWVSHIRECVHNTASQNDSTKIISIEGSTNHGIPCEYCDTEITLSDWESHSRKCTEEHKKKLMHTSLTALIPCEYCNEQICLQDLELHSRQCANTSKRTGDYRNNNEENESAETLIPCEYCSIPINIHDFTWHMKQCEVVEKTRIENIIKKSQLDLNDNLIPCEFCKKAIDFYDFEAHQIECQRKSNASAFQNNLNQNLFGGNLFFPEYWDQSSPHNLSRYILEHNTEEYKFVTDKFCKTLPSNQIIKIERIQNRRWYRQYDAHRDYFIERYQTSTEEWLFHGCKGQSVDAIINDCFNRSHAIRCAVGQGIYFAREAITSLAYTQPDVNQHRHMFMARVLIGRTTNGNTTTRICPPGFDTTDLFTMAATYGQRQRSKYCFLLSINVLLLCFAIFIIVSMSIYWGFFEEWTIWTDYTMAWVEFNFFIYYWDRLTITRVYLSLIYIYGFVLLIIMALQIHAYRRRNIFLMEHVPFSLFVLAIITIIGGICWFAVTMINMNAGFLTRETFLLERLRFKGNAFKELKYREQAFHLVTTGRVPPRVFILTVFVNQRQRDFNCCGWNSYLDYAASYKTDLPDTCCHKYQRNFGCGKNMLINPDPKVVNTRGCGPLMQYWYRRGFWENIVMSLLGVLIGAYMIYVFQQNRKEFAQLRDEAEDRKRIIHTQSMASLRSINNNNASKSQTATNQSRYRYTGMKQAPANEPTDDYDSDDNSSTGFYEPRPILYPNA